MRWLHTTYRFACGVTALLVLVTSMATSGPLLASAFGAYRYAADCGVGIQRSADANAYFVTIAFDSAAAPDIAVELRGRLLRVGVWQGDARSGSACRARLQKSMLLPRDSDAGRLQRRDEAGRVLLVIPRLPSLWR
jgi:hypothetical protein